MKKKRIGIDIDGVLYDFVGTFRNYVASIEYLDPATLPDPSRWAFWSEWGLTKERFTELFDGYIGASGFLQGDLSHEWIAVLRDLSKRHHIIFVTARGMSANVLSKYAQMAKSQTLKWLDMHRIGDIPVAFALNKDVLGLDIHLDDASHHLAECDTAGIMPVCWDASHNQDWPGHRVRNPREFYDFIEQRGIWLEQRLEGK